MGKSGKDKGGKKLSWIYRQKKRSERSKSFQKNNTASNTTNNVKDGEDNKSGRIIVRNLSFQVKEEEVLKLYEPFGKIKEINLPKRSDGKLIGCGFVQFQNVTDASKAIFNTNKKEFLGRVINVDWAIPKSKFCQKIDNANSNKEDTNNEKSNSVNESNKEQDKLLKQKHRKLQKQKNRRKRARIVIRNLSFEATEDMLKEHFSEYGTIEEVMILKRENGTLIGCAFVQFEHVQSAAKAIHYANMKPFLDRPIVVDWAIPKSKFHEIENVKKEPVDEEDIKVEIKEEPIDEDTNIENMNDTSVLEENVTINSTIKEDSENDTKVGTDSESDIEELGIHNSEDDIKYNNNDSSDTDNNDEDNDDDNDDDDEKLVKMKEENDDEENNRIKQEPRRISNDITEGKTVFLKNVAFSVKNNDLKKYMEQHFGPVYYALICIDPLTEHSKGTAFVKFKNVEDAERCLSGNMELRLCDEVMEAHRALKKNEVEDQKSIKDHRNKDSRNLYLVKEGVIVAGSPAAAGVSVTDMSKRLQLEQWKTQMLRNLNMFVSRVRLVVHNLPSSLDDSKLRQIFQKHSGSKAIIREARVMRDMKNIDANGVGKSKEYGFVSFTCHEDALRALRSINNNPDIFTKHRRPIVGFSIENRIMTNAKEKRLHKSREHNPLWSGNKEKRKSEETERSISKRPKIEKNEESDKNNFAGLSSKPGITKLRSKFKLKTQAMIHSKTAKKENKKAKAAIKEKLEKQEKRQKTVKTKPTKKFDPEEANFNKLVNSYKNKLLATGETKSKWYEAA